MNNTSQAAEFSFHPAFVFTSAIFYVVILTTSVLGNLLVCTAICFNKSLRSSPTMTFIFSLACSDLLTACLAMPFDVESLLVGGVWKHTELLCIVWTTAYLFSVPTSMLTLVVLTVDRYKALSDPLSRFRKRGFLSLKRSRVVMVFLWCYCLAFSLIPIMGWRYYPSHVINGNCYFNITPEYSALTTVIHFVLPIVIISGIYLKIYRIAQNVKGCQDFTKASVSSPSHIVRHPAPSDHGNFQRNLKATKTIALIICALFFCWFPFCAVSFTLSLCKQCYFNSPPELLIALLILGYLNSALSPFIYSLRNRRIRETYHNLYLSIIKFGLRGAKHRSRLGSSSSQRSTSSIIFSRGRHAASTSGYENSVRLTSYNVSIKLPWFASTTVKSLLRPQGAYLFQTHLRGGRGFIETRGLI